MGLATMPSASEGVLCIILVNTAVPFTLFRHIIRTLLLIIGVQLDSAFTSSSGGEPDPDFQVEATATPNLYLEEFRTQTPAVRFDSVCKKNKMKMEDNKEEKKEASDEDNDECECLVCLSKFEPESQINDLPCGHLFHKTCLEQWVDYWNITCPLCRTPFVATTAALSPVEEDEGRYHNGVW